MSNINKALDHLAAIARWGSARRGRISPELRRAIERNRRALRAFRGRRGA